MASRKNRNLTLSKAIQGHLIHCRAADFSQNTILDYQNTFRQFIAYLGDESRLIGDITAAEVQAFMAHMAGEEIPVCQGVTSAYKTGRTKKRSPKTLRNYHTALAALWTWATANGFAREHILRDVQAPKVNQTPIQPLTSANIIDLLRACDDSRPWRTKPLTRNFRPTAERDKAIIALFVETAMRAEELIALRIKDITFNKTGGQALIRKGKGNKQRWVPFSRRCAKFLHDWLLIRAEYQENDPLFVNLKRNAGLPMTRQVVARQILRLGKKIGIHVTPHRLRTTAACMMVRNGMTAWELQRIMGHSDISTTMRYVKAALIDLDQAMANASPLDNLRL